MYLPDYIDSYYQKLQNILNLLIQQKHQINLDIFAGYFRIEAY